ncbi:integral membrane sensor signal transduction histidine kinase [Syntrophobotulus glycolicus DSM 8271]|uniref:histidine kinase n=1 Tax=Syntrophobotulus glycolicus (strain DSM 8271 / FlGlyR) TaxID=645991 RepID=F0SV46_SYNGF|nr:HAMP domain-containing sensor histidine kinase [Syntrophobotulus glycolicus]ADY55546.1 integral membrane sensor signal transduction histidine kinase [Syntrophobotulus glycolicus DSM 8271]
MKIFTNQDIKTFFLLLSFILGGFLFLHQFTIWFFYGVLNPILLLLSFLAALGLLGVCFLYFRKQNQIMEDAVSQLSLYLSGDRDARIECDREGSLYKLFHAVNTLATALDAHASKEQKTKEFLKDTISDISHQLKTPLAALNIYNGLLQDDTEDMAGMREFAAKSEKEIARIETLVQNLLKITRLDAGSIIIERSSENIADMAKDIRRHFAFRAGGEQKTIILSGPDHIGLFCDRVWLTEAISNIVKNALDHTDTGGQIVIEWKGLPAITQITVRDNGSGIHPEDIHHIFKRFYRSRFFKDTQGIGLGLPLAKAIVEAHGGSITADSALGKGSAFVMSFLPLQDCKPKFM